MVKYLLSTIIAALLLAPALAFAGEVPQARNVILMISDGAGLNGWQAADYYKTIGPEPSRIGSSSRIDPWAHTAVSLVPTLEMAGFLTGSSSGAEDLWRSQPLNAVTASGLIGAIAPPTAQIVGGLLGVTESKFAEVVAVGVYDLRGWGIAASVVIKAPNRE